MINCRTCRFEKDNYAKASQHKLVDANIFCQACHYNGANIWHGDSDDFSGEVYECGNCHNYLLYTDKFGKITKDEIYFEDGLCLIRDIIDSDSTLDFTDKSYCINHIITYSNIDELYEKLQTYLMFVQ